MKIKQHLTKVNYNKGSGKKNEYLVIHWVGSVSTAFNNAKYFETENRGASAHYFVDDASIYQVVADADIAWHCGTAGGKYKQWHKDCFNKNSIGIEMCLDQKNHISDATIANTAHLVKELMKQYKIPAKNVIRHYDVTHKLCPAPYVDEAKWKKLHEKLTKS